MKAKNDPASAVLRILASFFVVVIHVSDTVSWQATFWNVAARFSVPVFVILSGFYMLERPRAIKTLWKKALRLLGLMIVWSAVYYGYAVLAGEIAFTGVKQLLTYLLTQPVHFWYVYAAAALYVLTPGLYLLAEHADRATYRYLLSVFFVLGCIVTLLLRIPQLTLLAQIMDKTKMPTTLAFVFLYLLGGYYCRYPVKIRPAALAAIWSGCIGVAFGGMIILRNTGLGDTLVLSFFAPTSTLAAACCFLLVREICQRYHVAMISVSKKIEALGNCTFGIYLVHFLIWMILRETIFGFPALPPIIAVPLRAVVVFALSAIAVRIGRSIPFLRKLFA